MSGAWQTVQEVLRVVFISSKASCSSLCPSWSSRRRNSREVHFPVSYFFFPPMIHLFFCIYKSLVLQWIGHFLKKIGYHRSLRNSILQQGVDELQPLDWLPSFTNNVLLAHSHTHRCMHYLWLLSRCSRGRVEYFWQTSFDPLSWKYSLSGPLQETFTKPYSTPSPQVSQLDWGPVAHSDNLLS